jgi:small basic protein (TIGR04137 family)
MSIDKSLKKRGSLVRARNVLKRDERIARLRDEDRWTDASEPYGLPKVRVFRIVTKKAKKAKKEEADDKKKKK